MSTPPTGDQNPASPSEQKQIIADLKEHWRKIGYEFSIKSVERFEEGAKQLVALNGTLQGLFLAVFAFSNLRDYGPSPLVFLFLLPMLCSIASIIFATRVYMQREYDGAAIDDISLDAWARISDVYRRALTKKRSDLHQAYRLLIISFVLLVACVGLALGYPPEKSAPTPTQIMIVTATLAPSPAPVSSPTP